LSEQQQRKPGASKDISDLKARLGLKQPAGAAPAPAAPAPTPQSAPPPAGLPVSSRPPIPGAAPAAPAQPAAPDPARDPYSAMRPREGQMFDLRLIDDGKPAVSVQQKGGKGGLIVAIIVGLVAFGVGAGFGMASVGRQNYNTANAAAKRVKDELDNMQKTLTQIGQAVVLSNQRAQQAKRDPLLYDPELTKALEAIKLDPRPDTSKIFRVDFYRLPDDVVDALFNYYYDSIALYGEVERHVRKTNADKESLEKFAEKAATGDERKNYGVVFDNSSKITVSNLVEIGEQVCKDGGKECGASDLVGFKVRANTGAAWVDRKIDPKAADRVVPIKPTPLFDAVMNGSPEQVRAEAYRQRVAGMSAIWMRLTAAQKDLFEKMQKAASRPDLFTLF